MQLLVWVSQYPGYMTCWELSFYINTAIAFLVIAMETPSLRRGMAGLWNPGILLYVWHHLKLEIA